LAFFPFGGLPSSPGLGAAAGDAPASEEEDRAEGVAAEVFLFRVGAASSVDITSSSEEEVDVSEEALWVGERVQGVPVRGMGAILWPVGGALVVLTGEDLFLRRTGEEGGDFLVAEETTPGESAPTDPLRDRGHGRLGGFCAAAGGSGV